MFSVYLYLFTAAGRRRQTQLVCLFVPPARNIHIKLNYPHRTDHFLLLTQGLLACSLFTQVWQAARGDYGEHVGEKILATWQGRRFLRTQRTFYFLDGENRVLKITLRKISCVLQSFGSPDCHCVSVRARVKLYLRSHRVNVWCISKQWIFRFQILW